MVGVSQKSSRYSAILQEVGCTGSFALLPHCSVYGAFVYVQ